MNKNMRMVDKKLGSKCMNEDLDDLISCCKNEGFQYECYRKPRSLTWGIINEDKEHQFRFACCSNAVFELGLITTTTTLHKCMDDKISPPLIIEDGTRVEMLDLLNSLNAMLKTNGFFLLTRDNVVIFVDKTVTKYDELNAGSGFHILNAGCDVFSLCAREINLVAKKEMSASEAIAIISSKAMETI